jgi:hypothetical protein
MRALGARRQHLRFLARERGFLYERPPETPWRNVSKLARHFFCSSQLIVVLVGIGVVLRVAQYFANRSLWFDEATLALNIIDRPVGGLTKPLDFNQGAPIGFLLVEELASQVFGFSEYALRLFPLLCGLVSIPPFVWLARRVLSAPAVPLAVLLFVVADGLIYYSSEVKPYEGDVAAAVGLLVGGTLLAKDVDMSGARALVIAVGGLALIALSFAAVFMVAAIAGTLAVRLAFNWRERFSFNAALAVLSWIVASIAIAIFALTKVGQIRESFEAGSGLFLGVTGSSSPLHAANVMGTNVAAAIGFLQRPPFHHLEKIALLFAVIGLLSLLRQNRTHLSMLVVPVALVLAASAAHLYPISQRTELFLLPAIILLIAEGIAQLVQWTPRSWRVGVALILVLAVAAGPIWLTGQRLIHPRTREEIRPVLAFIRDHWRTGDTIYVHYGAQYAFLYYEECDCVRLTGHGDRHLWPVAATGGREEYARAVDSQSRHVLIGPYAGDDWLRYQSDLGRLAGRGRVWFLYTHFRDLAEESFIEDELIGHLDKMGTRVDGVDRPRAHAYLYIVR